jgi:SOS response regulatory protein OraA/RecX
MRKSGFWFTIAILVIFIFISLYMASYLKQIASVEPAEDSILFYERAMKKPWYQEDWFYKTLYITLVSAVFLMLFGSFNVIGFRVDKRMKKLLRFIAKRAKRGYGQDKIISELKELGYRQEYIKDAMYRYNYQKKYHHTHMRKVVIFDAILKGLRKFKTMIEIKSQLISKGYHARDIDYYFHLYLKRWEEENMDYEFSKSDLPVFFRNINYKFRKKVLFRDIKTGLKLSKNFSEIKENLLNRGYMQKHVEDAVFHYKHKLQKVRMAPLNK